MINSELFTTYSDEYTRNAIAKYRQSKEYKDNYNDKNDEKCPLLHDSKLHYQCPENQKVYERIRRFESKPLIQQPQENILLVFPMYVINCFKNFFEFNKHLRCSRKREDL